MALTYSIEFKEDACKRVQLGVPVAQVARELGINVIYSLHMDVPIKGTFHKTLCKKRQSPSGSCSTVRPEKAYPRSGKVK